MHTYSRAALLRSSVFALFSWIALDSGCASIADAACSPVQLRMLPVFVHLAFRHSSSRWGATSKGPPISSPSGPAPRSRSRRCAIFRGAKITPGVKYSHPHGDKPLMQPLRSFSVLRRVQLEFWGCSVKRNLRAKNPPPANVEFST